MPTDENIEMTDFQVKRDQMFVGCDGCFYIWYTFRLDNGYIVLTSCNDSYKQGFNDCR